VPRIQLHREWDDWPRVRVMQFLMIDDAPSLEISEVVRGNHQVEPALPVPADPDRLSAISEHSSEDSASAQSLATFLRHDDRNLQCCLDNTYAFLQGQFPNPRFRWQNHCPKSQYAVGPNSAH
jgi:hypothetical protein